MPVTSLTASVDPDTFSRWNAALVNLQQGLSVPVAILPPVPSHLAVPQPLPITGLELLLEIGVACARPSSLDDPARLFALFRYATSLSDTAPDLTLNRDLQTLDRHKKGVLSDEFGCGMACLVGRKYGHVDAFLDVDDGVRQGWIRTAAPQSKRPDYIGLVRDSSNMLFVLEAKGSQGSGTYCRKIQIPAGCRQVAAVRPQVPYSVAARVVVATLLQRENQPTPSTIFVGDPEENQPYDYEFRGELPELIERDHFARVAILIGAEGMTRALRDISARPNRGEIERSRPGARRVVQGVEYLGSELVFQDGSRTAGLFVGNCGADLGNHRNRQV